MTISLGLCGLFALLTSGIVFGQRRTFPDNIGTLVYETGRSINSYDLYWGGLNYTTYATAENFLISPLAEWQERMVNSVACAPDGRSILIASNNLYRLTIADHTLRPIAPIADWVWELAWSPDGQRIAFANSKREIYITDTDGGNRVKLIQTQLSATSLAWSPDGQQIALTLSAANTSQNASVIHLLDVTTRTIRPIYESSRYLNNVVWSPDGRQIVFAMTAAPSESSIYTIQPDGAYLRRLTRGSYDIRPHWSPDGSLISYSSRRTNREDYQLYVMNADGSHPYLVYLGFSLNYALGSDDVLNDCWLKNPN